MLSAGGAAYQAGLADDAASEARAQSREQRASQQKLQQDFEKQQAETETKAAAETARREARRRQLALSTSGESRQDTILTSPLGVVGAPAAQQKTLLGA
jgi:hypothetical protein